jgi:hypothetical protein
MFVPGQVPLSFKDKRLQKQVLAFRVGGLKDLQVSNFEHGATKFYRNILR